MAAGATGILDVNSSTDMKPPKSGSREGVKMFNMPKNKVNKSDGADWVGSWDDAFHQVPPPTRKKTTGSSSSRLSGVGLTRCAYVGVGVVVGVGVGMYVFVFVCMFVCVCVCL